MNLTRKLTIFLSILSLIFSSLRLEACTGIQLVAEDNTFIAGRTLEFGVEVDTSIVVIPRGLTFFGTTQNGKGLTYTSKYAIVGAIAYDIMAVLDGMNEKGLIVQTFYFPGFASYTKLTTENKPTALSPLEFPHWILTQFDSIENVKNALNQVVIVPTISKEWGNIPPPFHYIIYDKSGHSIVIEPIEGKLVVHDNPVGVFTNSPTFDWHMTNLRNYINLTTRNAKSFKISGLELKPFGQGSGMVGMPGDFTPPSRFVRAFIYTVTAHHARNSVDSVFQAFHILNQFDIPKGVSREKVQDKEAEDYTMITAVKDPQTLKYYFKTYDNQTIKMVDLTQFDFKASTIKQVTTSGKGQALDISSSLRSL